MKISIVTVCYNSEKTIEDTLKSVLFQNYDNYEYLVIDGKSQDKTMDIVKSYENKFNGKLKYVTEKDKGLYDAMNKGIKMATGEVVGIINSDDVLAHPSVFSNIVEAFEKYNCDGVYSNLEMKDENLGAILRVLDTSNGNYKNGWYPPHPTLYLKKEIFSKYGYYNLNYKIAADYDFMVRIMKNDVKLHYVDDCFVYMRSGGVSTAGLKGYYKSFKDSYAVLKNNHMKFPLLVNIKRTCVFLKQVMKKNH